MVDLMSLDPSLDVFHGCENLSWRITFAPIFASAMDGFSNLSKRKLGRRDATSFKKLPHSDDFLLWQIAMSVRECSRTSIEHHTDSIARLIVNLCPQVL
jgi:hypothetical protein